MINLKTLFLLALISLATQDDPCFIKFESCEKEETNTPVETPKSNSKLPNCYYSINDDSICNICNPGFILNHEGTGCLSLENCWQVAEGNQKCKYCYAYYHPNPTTGKCERTLCHYFNDDDQCIECYDGYYLKGTECKKIEIPHCLKADSDGKKCKRCIAEHILQDDGTCKFPSKLIKGCIDYDLNGKCLACEEDDYEPVTADGACNFIKCKANEKKVEYCACDAGYASDKDGQCIGHDGSRYSSNSSNKLEISLIITIFGLLI